MQFSTKSLLFITTTLTGFACSTLKSDSFKSKNVYKTQDLIITQISKNVFQHISYKQTNDFGNVPCNGLVLLNGKEAIVFDTPINDKSAEALIKWVREKLQCEIKAVVPTHFHDDCLGGLQAFHDHQIPSYAYARTIELAKENKFVVPQNGFQDSLLLSVGDEKVIAKFYGEGHTKDNVIVYCPNENLIFGGCLIKALNASKGFLGDANTKEWSNTVMKISKQYPNVKLVVPGHGKYGDKSLLDYTIDLFETRYFGEEKLIKGN
jgi:metallo-beta-lactamase class B